MSIPQIDILLKTAIETAILDLRKNPWILDDIFGGLNVNDLAFDPMSQIDYGLKEVEAAKRWFLSNNILVILQFRTDTPEFPAISIVRGPARELIQRTSLADEGRDEDFIPNRANLTPQKILNNFTPKAYNMQTGVITLPDNLNTDQLAVGQLLVSSRSGRTYPILKIIDSYSFTIIANVNDDLTDAYIIPPVAQWILHREQTFAEETFYIGCHAQSDSIKCVWLSMIVEYILLRYKEAFLEQRGLELTTFTWEPIVQNTEFAPEMVFSRTCTLVGQVEKSWIKYIAPRFQSVRGGLIILDAPATSPSYVGETVTEGIYTEGDIRNLNSNVNALTNIQDENE